MNKTDNAPTWVAHTMLYIEDTKADRMTTIKGISSKFSFSLMKFLNLKININIALAATTIRRMQDSTKNSHIPNISPG